MKYNIPGMLSLFLVEISLLIGLYSIWISNSTYGIIYLTLLLISFPIILYAYCSKCSSRENCGHIIPGIFTRFLPKRKEGPYKIIDYIGFAVPMTLIAILPQAALWQNKLLFVLFWLFIFIAVIEIRTIECKKCKNMHCLLCANRALHQN